MSYETKLVWAATYWNHREVKFVKAGILVLQKVAYTAKVDCICVELFEKSALRGISFYYNREFFCVDLADRNLDM